MVNIENSNAQLPSDFHQGHYAVGNLLYHPIPRVTMGGEFQFGRRVNFSDGFNVNDYRMQFSFKFDWDKSFKSPSPMTRGRVSCQLSSKGNGNVYEENRIVKATFIIATSSLSHCCASALELSAQSTRTSPVAPRREVVAAVVQEAYDKFKDDNEREERRLHPLSRAGGFQSSSASQSSPPTTRFSLWAM